MSFLWNTAVILDGGCVALEGGGCVTGESQELSGVNASPHYEKCKTSGGPSPRGLGLLLSCGPTLLWD